MVRPLICSALFLFACGTPTAKEVNGPKSPTDPVYEKCVTECTQANQMRAVDPASIVNDCQKSCKAKGETLKAGPTAP